METGHTPLDRLYALVANDEDARACKDISDDACRVVPGNFFLTLCSLVLTKTGDLLASPKIVLAWLLGSIGAPPFLIAWLVPIRESGSLIPQLAIGAWVRRHPRRAGFWVMGSAMQGVCVAGMALAVWKLDGWQAGLAVLGLLIVFSLSRGFCSVSMKTCRGSALPCGTVIGIEILKPASREFGDRRYYRRTRSHRVRMSDGTLTGHDRMSLR
jgi:hypothetical protein